MGSTELVNVVLVLEGTSSPRVWKGLCPTFPCLSSSESLCEGSVSFKQPGEILRRLEKCNKSVG